MRFVIWSLDSFAILLASNTVSKISTGHLKRASYFPIFVTRENGFCVISVYKATILSSVKHTYFSTRPTKFSTCGVVFAVPVFYAKAPY